MAEPVNSTRASELAPAQNASETTPLLATETLAPGADTALTARDEETSDPKDQPLPVLQILLLCYVRLIDPISFFSIFPFINQMVASNGHLPASSVGYYSGLIESLLSLTQMFTMVFWGRASDRFGRKPVLVVSLAGMSLACGAFGFATTIGQMIALRCMAGVFAGTQVTVRTMIQEYSTPRTQARAFSWFAFAGNIGIFVGPLMGGALAEPAKQYGGWFRTVGFFEQYPYALPTLVTGLFGVTATLVAAFGIEETLKSNKGSAEVDDGLGNSPVPKPDSGSVLYVLKAPGVRLVMLNQTSLMLLAFGYTAVAPVYWYTPRNLGGYGFSELQISILMAATGAAQAVWLLAVFPPLQKRVGSRGVMRACGVAYPLFLAVSPLMGLLLRYGGPDEEVAFWVIAPILLSIGVGISMSFTAVQLCLNAVAPSPETLGALNSIALALVSGVRAFTPVLFTSLFATGVKNHLLDGQFVWLILIICGVMFAIATMWLPEKTDDRSKKQDET